MLATRVHRWTQAQKGAGQGAPQSALGGFSPSGRCSSRRTHASCSKASYSQASCSRRTHANTWCLTCVRMHSQRVYEGWLAERVYEGRLASSHPSVGACLLACMHPCVCACVGACLLTCMPHMLASHAACMPCIPHVLASRASHACITCFTCFHPSHSPACLACFHPCIHYVM